MFFPPPRKWSVENWRKLYSVKYRIRANLTKIDLSFTCFKNITTPYNHWTSRILQAFNFPPIPQPRFHASLPTAINFAIHTHFSWPETLLFALSLHRFLVHTSSAAPLFAGNTDFISELDYMAVISEEKRTVHFDLDLWNSTDIWVWWDVPRVIELVSWYLTCLKWQW